MNIDWESLLKLLQSGGDQSSPSAGLMQLAGGHNGVSIQTEKAIRQMENSNRPVPVQELQNIRSEGFYTKPDPNLTIEYGGKRISQKDYQTLLRADRARKAAMMLSQ